MIPKAEYYIDKLQLKPHPEGGWFKEIYRSDENISEINLPERYDGDRSFSTSIYFLLEGKQISAFHKLKSDELWHFYDGSTLNIYLVSENGILETIKLGNNLIEGETFQTVIKRNTWFAAEVEDKNSFGLIGCTVSPGFDFTDFILGRRKELIKMFPRHKELIIKLSNP